MSTPVTVDFETFGIEGRPSYPPRPVGVAVKWPGRKSRYLAWGHPVENNCAYDDARVEMAKIWDSGLPVLMHNAKFDLDVAETFFRLPPLPWQRVHDTMFLLFLYDPHSPDLHLKSSAERLLHLPPEERDAVRDWLLEHQPVEGVRITGNPGGREPWGKYIAHAPGKLVGRYAVGDVDRTLALFEKICPGLDEGMGRAYDRERRLLPHLLAMERHGLRVDRDQLELDHQRYSQVLSRLDQWLRRLLRCDDLNVNSGEQLAEALIRAGKAPRELLDVSPKTGKPLTNKLSLARAITDPQLLAVLRYRSALSTCLSTFMGPWLETANRTGGLIYTNWFQTREPGGGTRTGRLSSSPNFQNIPKTFEPLFRTAEQRHLPPAPWRGMPGLPWVRRYVTPYTPGDVLYDRDYSQQEYRILAHYDDDAIMAAYHANPRMDFHTQAQQMISRLLGYEIARKPIKNMGFGLLYGMGIGLLAERMGVSTATASEIKKAYLSAVTGIRRLYQGTEELARSGQPVRTWGGRLYYVEKPRRVTDKKTGVQRYQEFYYKLPNVIIQGSAADCTKEAMVRYCEWKPAHHRLLITLHDELLVSAPPGEDAMEILKGAMESVEFDVPMLSEGKSSTTNWAELTEVREDA